MAKIISITALPAGWNRKTIRKYLQQGNAQSLAAEKVGEQAGSV
jgi:hypothetical protein